MNLPDLEAEALKLPAAERARLAETLLESLDELSEEEHRRLWTEEAVRRAAELDADPSRGPGPSMDKHAKHMSHSFSGALRTFSFWVAAGSVGLPLLEGVEYRQTMLEEPSLMEMAYAIFANVIELDEQGDPVNAKFAEHRAAQHIRNYCDPAYEVAPPFEEWEVELYAPPSKKDIKPWPIEPGS